MKEHTAYPWIVAGVDNELEGYKVVTAPAVIDADDYCERQYIATVYEKSDANVIAAAPELLEALELLIDEIGIDEWDSLENGYAARTALKAIAKARGKK